MEQLEKTLLEIQDLLKDIMGMPSPKTPKAPTIPTLTPTSKKNPVNVAQQIKDPSTKKIAVKQAKKTTKISPNGQWSLS